MSDEVQSKLRAWGGPDEMSAFEAIMWRAEVDPRLRSTTTSVLMLDRVPDWERLEAGHRWVVKAVPRFRQRVVVPALGIGNPHWVDDADFHLGYHLRRISLPAPGDDRQLFDLAQNLAMTPFDRARPPWEATLVEGLAGGRAAYILKLHHATSDGMGVIQLLTGVLGKQREESQRPAPPAVDRSGKPLTSFELATRQLRRGLIPSPLQSARQLSGLGRAVGALVADAESPRRTVAYLRSAARMLSAKAVPGSGLFRKRSLSWRFDGIEIPLDRFKAAARAADASINDCFLAGLIGGFRRYHEEMGVPIQQMPIGFPISLRTDNDPMGGNKFAGSQYAAPVDERDPITRIRHIQQFVSDTRAEPALDIMIRLMPVVTRLPLAAITAMTADFIVAQDAQVSNIPGIREPVYMAGAQVTHFWPFAPAAGCGMMITMMSHTGRCCIGINTDQAAVTEPDLLRECFAAGLEEILALGESAQKPVNKAAAARPRRQPRRRSAKKVAQS